jgi:hypothetical protein
MERLVAGGDAMWRVILRTSYTGDLGSGLRNNVVPIFQALGLQHTATGTFESPAVNRVQAANHLSQVLQAIANPQQFPEVHAQAVLPQTPVGVHRPSGLARIAHRASFWAVNIS